MCFFKEATGPQGTNLKCQMLLTWYPFTYLKNISLLFFTCDNSHTCRLGFWWAKMFFLVCHCCFSEWLVRFILIGWAGTWSICTGMRQIGKSFQLLICNKKCHIFSIIGMQYVKTSNLHSVLFELSSKQSYITLDTQSKILSVSYKGQHCKWIYEISCIWTAEKDMNLRLIIADIHTTWAVVKLKLEKNSGLNRIQTHHPSF